MALKEEIFDQNSTLFAILDENEVTEIGAISNSVNALSLVVDQNKLQLDGLAIRVDQQQARNEEQFVNFNTHILQNSDDINSINVRLFNVSERVTTLENAENNDGELIEELDERVNSIAVQLSSVSDRVTTLENTENSNVQLIEELGIVVNGQETIISEMRSQLDDLTAAFLDLRRDTREAVTNLDLKTSNGVKIMPGFRKFYLLGTGARIMSIDMDVPEPALCYMREYDVFCTGLQPNPWLYGEYSIRFYAAYFDNIIMPGYFQTDIPICSGRLVYCNLTPRGSVFPSSPPIPVLLWFEP
jgi:uncharacterized coiled-coil protein SlyX